MKLEKQLIVANNLRLVRVITNQSQEQVAKQFDISRSLYCGYENGNRTPDADFLYDFAKHFGFSLELLFESDMSVFLNGWACTEIFDEEIGELIELYMKLSPFWKGRLMGKAHGFLEMDRALAEKRSALKAATKGEDSESESEDDKKKKAKKH